VLGAGIGLAVISNISATFFFHLTGGVGLLDLDGGANLLHPSAGRTLPPAGTPDRILAILTAYSSQARMVHSVLLCTLDLVFPPALALTGWTTIAWATKMWSPRWRTGAHLTGATLALAYLCADWAENVTELFLLAGHRGIAVTALPHLTATKLDVFALLAVVALGAAAVDGLRRRQAGSGGSHG